MREEHWWDNLLWVLVFMFLIPSSLVVASWNSLPGSHLYKVKLLAEDAMVAISFSKAAKSELEVSYADKRLADATQLLSESESADGLEYFRKQMQDAKIALAQAPDTESKQILTQRYVTALQNASHQLEQQKQNIHTAHGVTTTPKLSKAQGNAQGSVAPQVVREREIIVVKEVTKVNVVTQVNQVTQVTQVTQVIEQIDQTQNEITNIINQVQNAATTQAQDVLPSVTQAPILPTDTPPIQADPPAPNTVQNSFGDMPGQNGNSNNSGNQGNGNGYGGGNDSDKDTE